MTQPHAASPISQPSSPSQAPPPAPSARPSPPAEVLRCDSAADFLAALPRLVGFTADNSLFTVFFTGSRAASAIRVDLPAADDAITLRRFIDPLVETLVRSRDAFGSSPPALVVASATTFAEHGGLPWRRLASRLRRRLTLMGWVPREFCCLAPDGWASYLDPFAPARGRPLAEIAASRHASAVALPTLETLGEPPAPSPAQAAAVAQAVTSHSAASPKDPETLIREASVALSALLAPEYPRPEIIAEVIRTITGLEGWVALFDAAFDDSRRSPNDRAARVRLEHLTARLSECAALTMPDQRADLLAAAAQLWWFRGLQSVALRELDAARRISPKALLPRCVAHFIEHARFPFESPA